MLALDIVDALTRKSINKTKLKKDYYFFGTSMTKKGDVNYNFNI